jgi:hypothetical protein
MDYGQEFYMAMAYDIAAAVDNDTTAAEMISSLDGTQLLGNAKEYAESVSAPWPPNITWVTEQLLAGGMPSSTRRGQP